jgi:hypothetical protein
MTARDMLQKVLRSPKGSPGAVAKNLPDPMLDAYQKEGIFGTRPGMVKVNGKEMVPEKALEVEEQERVKKIIERVKAEKPGEQRDEEFYREARPVLYRHFVKQISEKTEQQQKDYKKSIRMFWYGAVGCVMSIAAILLNFQFAHSKWYDGLGLIAALGTFALGLSSSLDSLISDYHMKEGTENLRLLKKINDDLWLTKPEMGWIMASVKFREQVELLGKAGFARAGEFNEAAQKFDKKVY